MTSNPVSLFVMAQGINQIAALDHIVKANYATISVLDDFEFCRKIKDALPQCVVVFRSSTFSPAPGPDAIPTLTRFLDGIQSQDKRIVVMVSCENGFSADYCNMWADFIVTADPRGWKLCVGNVSSGSVKCGQGSDPNDWLNMGTRLLKVLAVFKGHYLGWHDYTFPYPWAVSNGDYGLPDKPPDKIDWAKAQYHIGRNVQGIQNACKALNIAPPHCIATETLIDTMGDIVAHFGYKADGYKQLTDKWREWFPTKDRGDVLADFHIWAWEHVYAPVGFVIGMHTYCYGNTGNNPQWEPYRVDNEPRYIARMETYRSLANTPPPAPPVVQPPAPIVIPPVPPPPDAPSNRAALQQRLVIAQQAKQLVIELLQKEIDDLISQLSKAA